MKNILKSSYETFIYLHFSTNAFDILKAFLELYLVFLVHIDSKIIIKIDITLPTHLYDKTHFAGIYTTSYIPNVAEVEVQILMSSSLKWQAEKISNNETNTNFPVPI